MYLNRENRTAWPSQRRLAEDTGMSRTHVQRALAQLVAGGHLAKTASRTRVGNRYDVYQPLTRRDERDRCDEEARVEAGNRPAQTGQGGPSRGARVAPLSGPEPLKEPLKEPLINDAPHRASPSGEALEDANQQSEVDEKKRSSEVETVAATQSDLDTEAVDFVTNIIQSEGGPLKISKIIAMCRESGCYSYSSIDGRLIAAMAKAGHLARNGDWIDVPGSDIRDWPITKRQLRELRAYMTTIGADIGAVCRWASVERLEDIRVGTLAKLMEALQKCAARVRAPITSPRDRKVRGLIQAVASHQTGGLEADVRS
jgi:hypothetical protein